MAHLIVPHPGVRNPFEEYPVLEEIWPDPYRAFAYEASKEDCQTGQILFIINRFNVVGITGIFFEPENDEDVFLRWTGIMPEARKFGIGKQAIQQVISLCKGWLPGRKRLVELIPDNEYGDRLVEPFFYRCGFVPSKIGKHEVCDWPTVAYAYDLKVQK